MSHAELASKPTLAQHATSSHQYWNCIRVAADFVRASVGTASMAIVLGSGLMDFVDKFEQNPPPKMIEYSRVPYMPGTNVPGHSGKIYVGQLMTAGGVLRSVMCFAGRVHAYEGWFSTEFNFIVRLAHACGTKVMVLTNSAGGALQGMSEGSVMLIRDHMRFSGINPLADVNEDPRFGPRHTRGEGAYSTRIAGLVRTAAQKLSMPLVEGTYCWTSGPSYETPSEVRAGMSLSLGGLGGAFGMSTVPEVLAARALGMEVFALSLCTNLAAGLSDKELAHSDVKEVAEVAGPRFQQLLLEMFAQLDVDEQLGKQVLPVDFEPAPEHAGDASSLSLLPALSTLGSAPSRHLYPLGGWTPSRVQVDESVARVAALCGVDGTHHLGGGGAVIFWGGKGQRQVSERFVAGLTQVRSIPLREVSSVFKSHPDLMSSFVREGVLLVGSLPAASIAAVATSSAPVVPRRVAVLLSPQAGGGLVGMNASEAVFFVQVLKGLGAGTLLCSAVGVDTSRRGKGDLALPGEAKEADASASSSSDAAAVAPAERVLLLEDLLDRTIEPLPLPLSTGSQFKTPLFDTALTLSLQRALLEGKSASDASFPVSVGSFLAFQGPQLPSPVELNMAFHAGAIAAAGVSNLAPVLAAGEIGGIKVAALVRTVGGGVESIVEQVGEEIVKDQTLLSHISNAMLSALSAAAPAALADAAAAAPVASTTAVSALPGESGFGPLWVQAHQEPFEHVAAAAAFVADKIKGADVKSFVFVEGMLAGAFAPSVVVAQDAAAVGATVPAGAGVAAVDGGASCTVSWECPVLEIPFFAESLGIGADGQSTGRSGPCFPHDPRVLMASWRLRLCTITAGAAGAKTVLLLANTANRSGLVPEFHGLNFMVRVGKHLSAVGVTNLLLLSPLASTSSDVAPGQLVLLRDHINLTGLSPLFGENDARVGPRFNDMSVVYRPAGRACFTSQQKIQMGAGDAAGVFDPTLIATSVVAQVCNPSLGSLSEAALARSIAASTLVSGLVPLATLARHTDLSVTAMGYVYRTAGASDDATVEGGKAAATAAIMHAMTPPSPATLASLRSLVYGAVDKLHDNGLVENAKAATSE